MLGRNCAILLRKTAKCSHIWQIITIISYSDGALHVKYKFMTVKPKRQDRQDKKREKILWRMWVINRTWIKTGLNWSADELSWPLIPLSLRCKCKALSTDPSTGHADFHDSNSKNSHQTLIRNPMLENMNNAAHLETLASVCTFTSVFDLVKFSSHFCIYSVAFN